MLSAKEIYERVRDHLLTQRAVSEDENGSCRLRCNDGRKCAIGSLIRDDLYCPDIEGVGLAYYRHEHDGALPRVLYACGVDVYDERIVELLTELEELHDNAHIDEWPQLLAALGQRHAVI
ncbi:hypothetical protein M0D69_37375 [Caballeronia sp. SEWSISQ10-4 2]|uniref:hypothetical protein n=1 Tax=Caballeronia sp. SEWSISQ10-4 2 TaxID=2937438 RepID=UPI00265448A4|nr:hypothetical protein [Caballeronia sp. SEWSISQ10-4 2]MDN7183586.1 hypothetical protein [Caballeronia sp. SEWSISQ10-4 2]